MGEKIFGISARSMMKNAIDSSEMICSLRYESARGVAYNVLSRCQVASISTVSCAIACISLYFGA